LARFLRQTESKDLRLFFLDFGFVVRAHLRETKTRATADPSTSLRFAQDDSFVVVSVSIPDQISATNPDISQTAGWPILSAFCAERVGGHSS
jgi:hypothetical protein